MIGFADFVPALIQEEGVFREYLRAPIQEAVDRANQWIRENNVQVLNIETVVMPNILAMGKKGPQESAVTLRQWWPVRWYQFVRVWYKCGAQGAEAGEGPSPRVERR